MVQPSSVDVRLDKFFRLFDNHKYPVIDPAQDQADLTRLVEVDPAEGFVLHPGEFVLGSTLETVSLPDDLAARVEGKSSLGPARPAHPRDRRLRRPGLHRPRHPRAVQRRDPADHALARDEDRPARLLPALLLGREPLRLRSATAPTTRASAARRPAAASRTSTARTSDHAGTAAQHATYVEVRVTGPDAATAARLARLLVEERARRLRAGRCPASRRPTAGEGAVETRRGAPPPRQDHGRGVRGHPRRASAPNTPTTRPRSSPSRSSPSTPVRRLAARVGSRRSGSTVEHRGSAVGSARAAAAPSAPGDAWDVLLAPRAARAPSCAATCPTTRAASSSSSTAAPRRPDAGGVVASAGAADGALRLDDRPAGRRRPRRAAAEEPRARLERHRARTRCSDARWALDRIRARAARPARRRSSATRWAAGSPCTSSSEPDVVGVAALAPWVESDARQPPPRPPVLLMHGTATGSPTRAARDSSRERFADNGSTCATCRSRAAPTRCCAHAALWHDTVADFVTDVLLGPGRTS